MRLAVIGAGTIGSVHADRIAAARETELSAIVDPAPAARELAAGLDVPVHETVAALFESDRPDGVVIAVPTAHHVEPTLAAMDAGIPVLLEKPIAATLAEADRLLTATNETGTPLLIGHHRRHTPLVSVAREVLTDGRLGRIIAVNGQWTLCKHRTYYDPGWRQLRAAGPVLTNLIHEIDMLRALVGEIDSVSAQFGAGIRGHEKEETAALTFGFSCGAVGSFLMSDAAPSPWAWEFATGENPNYPPSGQNTMRFVGSAGALEFPNLALWHHGNSEPDWRVPIIRDDVAFEAGDPYSRQLDHFCAVIRREASPLVTATDGTRSLAVALAVFEAGESGRVVSCASGKP